MVQGKIDSSNIADQSHVLQGAAMAQKEQVVPGSDSDETLSLLSHLEWGSHRDFSEDDCSDARSVLSGQKKPASISTSGNENVHLVAELPLPPT